MAKYTKDGFTGNGADVARLVAEDLAAVGLDADIVQVLSVQVADWYCESVSLSSLKVGRVAKNETQSVRGLAKSAKGNMSCPASKFYRKVSLLVAAAEESGFAHIPLVEPLLNKEDSKYLAEVASTWHKPEE